MVRCISRRDPSGIPLDLVDYKGAVAVFAFKSEVEHAGEVDFIHQLVVLVFGKRKALYYHHVAIKGLGWDMLSYGRCYEDTVDSLIEMLKFYMGKVKEGMYELVDVRIKPGYESLFPLQGYN